MRLAQTAAIAQGKQIVQIIGVVKTANYQSLGEAPQACYTSRFGKTTPDTMILYVKTERDPSTTLAAVQNEIRNLYPALPLKTCARERR